MPRAEPANRLTSPPLATAFIERRFRRLHLSGRLDHDIEAPTPRALLAQPQSQLIAIPGIENAFGSEVGGLLQAVRVAPHRHDPCAP